MLTVTVIMTMQMLLLLLLVITNRSWQQRFMIFLEQKAKILLRQPEAVAVHRRRCLHQLLPPLMPLLMVAVHPSPPLLIWAPVITQGQPSFLLFLVCIHYSTCTSLSGLFCFLFLFSFFEIFCCTNVLTSFVICVLLWVVWIFMYNVSNFTSIFFIIFCIAVISLSAFCCFMLVPVYFLSSFNSAALSINWVVVIGFVWSHWWR